MDKKLWIFGDSFSTPFWDSPFPLSEDYIRWKGGIPKVWGERLGDELGLSLSIHAKGGLDNYSILQSVSDKAAQIGSSDIVIIGWTGWIRFRLWESGRWVSYNPQNCESELAKGMIMNRMEGESAYSEEVRSWMGLIQKALPKAVFWVNNPQSLIPAEKVLGVQTIREETDGVIDDGHPSEGGHKVLADRFIRLLRNQWI